MAIVKTIKGDLISLFKAGEFAAIAHGANCFNTMGGGIAYQIKEHFPEAYEADKKYARPPLNKLGNVSVADTEYGVVINMYTQLEPGRNFEYAALKSALYELEDWYPFSLSDDFVIGIPLIGAGIGGGNWEIIKTLFEDSFLNFVVVEWEK